MLVQRLEKSGKADSQSLTTVAGEQRAEIPVIDPADPVIDPAEFPIIARHWFGIVPGPMEERRS